MAYKKDEIIELCLEVIEKECIFFVTELIAFIPISRPLFYQWKLDKLDILKDALNNSKVKGKNFLRRKWMENDNATTDIALYKLLADDEEIEKLSSNYTPKDDTKRSKFQVSIG